MYSLDWELEVTSKVFISHAGNDSDVALRVSDELKQHKIEAILDRETIGAGDSFLQFMEGALSTSDFCLLLWSQSAATRQWVQVEWEAALYKTVNGARAFLTVGRLDEHPLPALLAPRLNIPLHPKLEPGLSTLVDVWNKDRSVENESQRLVGAAIESPSTPEGTSVYLTSGLFGISCPVRVDLDAPALVVANALRDRFNLPTSLPYRDRVGLRFDYHLGNAQGRRFDPAGRLRDQGVTRDALLWLECDTKQFAATDPTTGGVQAVTFRGEAPPTHADAKRALLSAIGKAGLGY
jgi:hypothetical protein